MNPRRFRFPLVGIAALVLVGTALTATPASVTIDTVGGQTVVNGKVSKQISGLVTVQGRSALAQTASATAKPLVADAGDSAFVAGGETATLLGSGFGGAEPYHVRLVEPRRHSRRRGCAHGATLRRTRRNPHRSRCTVTDSTGAAATDTVKVVVFQPQEQTLLDQTKADLTPGATGTGAKVDFPFTVPVGTSRFDVRISWTSPANDYDLRVLDPSGTQRASHGDGAPTTEENAGVSGAEPGTWTVVADKFATAGDNVRAQVTATVAPGGDPRPFVKADGPYRFAIGAAQTLDRHRHRRHRPGRSRLGHATATATFESNGTSITDHARRGHAPRHPQGDRRERARAARDDLGPRRGSRATRPARRPRSRSSASRTRGINPYHLEFSAQTYPDPDGPAR